MRILRTRLKALFDAWVIRRSITLLEYKVKEFVHEDSIIKKNKLKREFHRLFKKIIKDKLFIYKKYK